jgi:p21-activated kinase 1
MEPVIEVNPPPETDASKENSVVPATETEKPVGGDAPHKPEENTTAPIVATGAELPKEDSTELNRTPSSTLGTKTRSKSDVGRGSNKENSTNDVQNKDNSKQESQEKKKKLGLGLGSLFGFLKKGKEKEKESTQSEQKSTNVADKTRRDDAPESEQTEEARAKQVIVVSTIEDFPEDCQKLIKHSELPREKLEANFQILMNVLHFRTGKIFKTPETVNNPPRPQLPKSTRLKKPEELLTEMTDFKKQYKDIEDLGKGGFGSVIQARCKDKKRLVAIKKMEHKTRKQKAANFHEAAILSMCSHNNIVKYLGCHEIKDELWVIMELMEGGTFEDAARSWRFNEENIAYIARELLKGIAYLHNNQLAHRDLKSANIMMSVRGEVKMIDLGLCADMSCGFPTHMVGSPFLMPP